MRGRRGVFIAVVALSIERASGLAQIDAAEASRTRRETTELFFESAPRSILLRDDTDNKSRHESTTPAIVGGVPSRRRFLSCCISTAAAFGASQRATAAESIDSNDAQSSDTLTALQESITGFISGSAVSTVKTLVKYPLDTATVRLQMPNTIYSVANLPELFRGSFDGIAAPLVSNIPAGAVFFSVKDAAKSFLKSNAAGMPKFALTSLAVAAALPPYWALRNPSEVIKTRLQVGAEGYTEGMSTIDAFELATSQSNSTSDALEELYSGYTENVLYSFPADIIKFVAYDYLTGGKGKKGVPPLEGAVKGALATGIAQLVTTPLDVVRNRIMAESTDDDANQSYFERLKEIADEGTLFAGSKPRIAKAALSGAIQFATYEETKSRLNSIFAIRKNSR